MPRAVLILLLSWAYVGCAGRGPEGLIRILPANEREAAALRAALDGPFFDDGDGGLRADPGYAGRGPFVEGIRFVQADGTDRGLVLRLGEADLAVVYGRTAGALIDAADRPLHLSRAPGWDRTYFLWLEPRHRWLGDPAFRRWLAGALEREPMLRFLFDGRGSAAYSLSSAETTGLPRQAPGTAPFSRTARPRLSLQFDRHDAHAASIAARIRAVLESRGMELELLPRLEEELVEGVREREVQLALLAHRPASDTLLRIGQGGRPEQELLREARIVPLVRLDAWLARPHRLEGVRAGPYPVLGLEKARWRR